MWAAYGGHLNVVNKLLQCRAEKDKQNYVSVYNFL